MEKEYKVFEAEVKESSEKDLTVVHFISTEKRDRGRDILYANGMKMEGRPVVLFQHGFNDAIGSEPIAKPLWIKPGEFKNRKGIQAKTQFYPDDLGKRLWQKTIEGYMPNWSVGWRPLRHEFKTEKDGVEIRHVYEWELLEYSLVAVPMQPDAQTLPGKDVEQIYIKMLPESEEKRGELVAWKRNDDTWEEKPYPNEHACRLEDPGKYIRIRRENDKFGKGIHAIWGVQAGSKPVELQAIRFDKSKFTVAEARAWLKDHKYTCKMFEPATGKCEKCGKEMLIKWPEDVSGENCGKTCDIDFTYEHDGECKDAEPELTTCQSCKKPFKYEDIPEVGMGYAKCLGCGALINQEGVVLDHLDERVAGGFFAQGKMLKLALDGVKTLQDLFKAFNDEYKGKIVSIEKQISDLSAQVSALSEAGKGKGEEDEPSELEIVDSEKDKEAVRAVIRQAVGEVLGELTQTEIDRMKGRVK